MNMQILLVLRADLFLVEHRWRFPLLSLIAMSTKNKIGETLLMVASVFSSQNDEYNRYKNKMVDTRQNSLSFRVSNFRSLLAGCFRTSRDIRWHCCKCCGRNGVCNTWLQFPYVAPDADNSQYLMKTCGEGLTWHVSLRTLRPCRVFLRWLSSRFKYSVGPNDPRGHQATSSLPARYLMASALPYDGYVPHIMAQQWLSHLCANYSLPKRTTSAPLRAYWRPGGASTWCSALRVFPCPRRWILLPVKSEFKYGHPILSIKNGVSNDKSNNQIIVW